MSDLHISYLWSSLSHDLSAILGPIWRSSSDLCLLPRYVICSEPAENEGWHFIEIEVLLLQISEEHVVVLWCHGKLLTGIEMAKILWAHQDIHDIRIFMVLILNRTRLLIGFNRVDSLGFWRTHLILNTMVQAVECMNREIQIPRIFVCVMV